MPQKLETVLAKVEEISNNVNKEIILEYHEYLISRDTSTNYQKDNFKLIYILYDSFDPIKHKESIKNMKLLSIIVMILVLF